MIPEPFTLERPVVDWTRHGRDGRPKIIPPPGVEWRSASGKTKQAGRYYTRPTTLAKALEDAHALYGWKLRRALVGIGQRPDYQVAAAALTIEDRDREALEQLAEACIEASGPSAALVGTALHTFTERVDRGEPLGYVPEAYRGLVEAWARITAPLRFEYREVRMVHDELEVAGTPDALGFCELPDPDGVVDDRRVIDLKSGSLKYPGAMSSQLYLYADSDLYDTETGERRPVEVNQRWGLIVHLKSDDTEPPGLYWISLEHGRRGVELARPVREWRAVKADAILVPALVEAAPVAVGELEVGDITDALVVASERVDEPPATAPAELEAAPVASLTADPQVEASRLTIAACQSPADLRALWMGEGHLWTDELGRLAADRHDELVRARDLAAPRAALLGVIATAPDREALHRLWTEHRERLWTTEHDDAAATRHSELTAGVA